MTHSAYVDICDNFIELFRENWKDCPFEIVGTVVGKNVKIEGIETIYIGSEGTLTDCINVAVDKYEADFYMCFLGDAFISTKICTSQVYDLLENLKINKANYCKLIPLNKDLKNKENEKRIIRNIKEKDRYAHTFVAFVATKSFVKEELVGKTDLEFEYKYLKIADTSIENLAFCDRFIVVKDVFHIIPSIVKGKWDRTALRIVKHDNPKINFSSREKMSILEQTRVSLINTVEDFVPSRIRKIIKKTLSEIGFKFATDK